MIHDYPRNYNFNKRKLKSWGSRIEAAKKSQKFPKGLNIVTIKIKYSSLVPLGVLGKSPKLWVGGGQES